VDRDESCAAKLKYYILCRVDSEQYTSVRSVRYLPAGIYTNTMYVVGLFFMDGTSSPNGRVIGVAYKQEKVSTFMLKFNFVAQ
jgi:hypothetical protein